MDRKEKLKEFLRASPGDSFLTHALALECIKEGADDEAKALFTDLLNANPDYVGSYYHLAKLHERQNDVAAAEAVYQKGMEVAAKLEDRHSGNELRAAFEELTL